ncbi:hypothetical protein Acr_06g0004400 [Actinidia rufa]|uniref:Uncharacterized protein n=1 Tax=Actinidia rufa TaxID=165716 RepID=A0A7J0EQD1_9ERIC|nr:hypothetical protein Acr_06g0004400 [Actinidia rufa]
MRYENPYIVWYLRITRTLVGNPAHRWTSGYVEIGFTIEIATPYIAAIHDSIDRAIYAYDRPESLQDMYNASDMCSRSLHTLREHQWIRHPGVPEPPPTIPPGVSAASLAMPPAIPIHPPPSSSRNIHIFIGKASLRPPTRVTDNKCIRLPWEDLFDKRCEQEMYCRWHGLCVPKTQSAMLFSRGSPNSQVIKALECEIDEMQRRLDKYHFTEYAKKECVDPTQRIIEINVDPLLVSDLELLDFSEEDGDSDDDDDFVDYLSSSISVIDKPLCCYEHSP